MPNWRPSDWVVLGMKKPGNDVRVQEVRGLGPGMKWVPRVQDGVCWKASNICRVKSHVYRLALIRWPFTRPRPGFSADFVPEFRLARARCKQIPGATLGTLSTYVRSFCLTLLLCTCYLVKSRVICRQYPSHVHAKTFTRTFSTATTWDVAGEFLRGIENLQLKPSREGSSTEIFRGSSAKNLHE